MEPFTKTKAWARGSLRMSKEGLRCLSSNSFIIHHATTRFQLIPFLSFCHVERWASLSLIFLKGSQLSWNEINFPSTRSGGWSVDTIEIDSRCLDTNQKFEFWKLQNIKFVFKVFSNPPHCPSPDYDVRHCVHSVPNDKRHMDYYGAWTTAKWKITWDKGINFCRPRFQTQKDNWPRKGKQFRIDVDVHLCMLLFPCVGEDLAVVTYWFLGAGDDSDRMRGSRPGHPSSRSRVCPNCCVES